MTDQVDIIKNISSIYDSNNSLRMLKDFERVIDELDVYVFRNWEDGELVSGPQVSKHFVECSFMWPEEKMPDPMGGKKLLDYGCLIAYKKDVLKKPRRVEQPGDFRPHSKKGKIDKHPIWIVNIKMPKQLIFDVFKGSVRDAKNSSVDLESIYQYSDAESPAPSTQAADAAVGEQSAQEPVANAPAQ
jgi:hypothetical protein